MCPVHSRKERLIDGAIHGLGVVGSVVAVGFLLHRVTPARDPLTTAAAAAYGGGLVAMVWLSAAYNLVPRLDWKERIRPYDHAAIFLMIAGTYTPFALVALGGAVGFGLFAAVWLTAAAGMALKLLRPRRWERAALVLYLALGWAGLPLLAPMIAALPAPVLALLGIGGLFYTAGVTFHLWERLPYQNAIWHGFVLAGAGCHFVAVLKVLGGGPGS